MPPRTVLVVGNGFTIDFMASAGLTGAWPPSSPLSWDVATHDGRDVRTCLPALFSEVEAVRADDPSLTDFGVIDEVVRRAAARQAAADAMAWPLGRDEGWAAAKLETEARHFLGLAYSAVDAALRTGGDLERWRWYRYIEALGPDCLLAVVSFNYETLLEQTLDRAGIPFFHCGVEPLAGLPVGKPHGSVDYALAENVIKAGEPDYPINIVVSLANAPMRRLAPSELARPRLHVEVVPPLAATRIRAFQWVRPIFDVLARLSPSIERCVFLGISAWGVDQPELCDVLRALTPGTEIVVANPDRRPRLVLEFHARRLGLTRVAWWPNGPPAVS